MTNAIGQLLHNESLSAYTTWRVGGNTQALYKPTSIDDVERFLIQLPKNEPVLWLGLGSNSLIRDAGFAGTTIITQGGLHGLRLLDNQRVYVEAGVSCAQMARFCARNQLAGGEFWAGIPGTMGGALRMNAGCFQAETWPLVVEVETITRFGERRRRLASEFEFAYRQVTGLQPDEWFISAICQLTPGDSVESMHKIKTLLAHRAATQPTSEYNCGSVFRNPPGAFAARLIEECGLKGKQIGGAMVSEKHANFIINCHGQAKAADIEALIKDIQQIVYTQTNIQLIQEVHIIGDQ